MSIFDDISNHLSKYNGDDWASLGLVGAGLGLGGYNMYRSYKRNKQAKKDMDNLITQLPKQLAKTTAKDMDNISKKLGLEIPVAVIEDDEMAKQYGVADNAYFMTPGFVSKALAKQLKDNIRKHHDKAGESGLVVMSNKFSPVPILAHELGHARDYKDGNLNMWPSTLASVGGTLAGLGLWGSGAGDAVMDSVHKSTGSKTAGALARAAAIGLPSLLAGLYVNSRSRAAERRATAHAKAILDKYRNRRAVATAGQLLDRAYKTYEDAHDAELIADIAGGVGMGGLTGVMLGPSVMPKAPTI